MQQSNIFIHGIDYNVLYNLPVNDILNMCQINKQFASVCNDEYYWKNKFNLDYHDYVEYKLPNITWKDTYLLLAQDNLKFFPVEYFGKLLGYICLQKTNTMSDALFLINQLYDNLVPIYEQKTDIYVHIILKNGKNTLAHKNMPVLLNTNNLLTDKKLWDNIFGFEFLPGKAEINIPRRPNEALTATLFLPNGRVLRFVV